MGADEHVELADDDRVHHLSDLDLAGLGARFGAGLRRVVATADQQNQRDASGNRRSDQRKHDSLPA